MEGSIRAAFPVVAKVGQQAHDRDTVEVSATFPFVLSSFCASMLEQGLRFTIDSQRRACFVQ